MPLFHFVTLCLILLTSSAIHSSIKAVSQKHGRIKVGTSDKLWDYELMLIVFGCLSLEIVRLLIHYLYGALIAMLLPDTNARLVTNL